MKIYNVGIIGCGRMGWLFNEDRLINQPVSHIAAYSKNKRTKVTAVCDIKRERLRAVLRKYGVKKVYTDYKEMLAKDEFDIVSICVPTELHSKVCIAAAESGVKAIFCEKPIATSLSEADKMIDVCRKKKVKLAINHTRRWDSSFGTVKEMLDKELIGKIGLITASSTVGLINSGTHLFDLLRQYFGDAVSVSGKIIPDRSTDPGGAGSIIFRGGHECFFDSRYRDYLLFGAKIYGEKGAINIGGEIRGSRVYDLLRPRKSKKESGIKELVPVKYKAPRWTPPILNAVDNIVRALDGREEISCNGEDGRASLEIALAFHQSSKMGGRKVGLPLKNRRLRVIPRMTSFTKDGRLR